MLTWSRIAPLVLVTSLAMSALPSRPAAPRPVSASRGLALLQHFNDSLPAYGGNGLRCTSCHLDDGRRGAAMSWVGVTTRYPRYRARRGSIETIEQRINECITRSLAGRALSESDPAMLDIVAYLDSLRDEPRPERPDTVRLAGDTVRGRALYQGQCARCHGANGAGGVGTGCLRVEELLDRCGDGTPDGVGDVPPMEHAL